ncbi:hypothetical protein GCM10010358_82450 [Streptomyces minutiscleroticus]|uniref:STAS domain-containing protein n=1 Tax=Streptomyces minutiscleroticus TaxID=68238 RepID=A0A918P4L2_9ACTN|nr:hypothetical protein [Streptomyces minutiscleroticus]GGY18974.1 hypothetical protein GCM10010358_82450 [Streptomyces minutiscleroticus]
MSDHFIDDLMFITPLGHTPGIKLFGEVTAEHKIPVTLAVVRCGEQHQEVTVDLTGIQYISQAALEALVDLARALHPSLHLTLRARPDLDLTGRLAARGWHGVENLQISEA